MKKLKLGLSIFTIPLSMGLLLLSFIILSGIANKESIWGFLGLSLSLLLLFMGSLKAHLWLFEKRIVKKVFRWGSLSFTSFIIVLSILFHQVKIKESLHRFESDQKEFSHIKDHYQYGAIEGIAMSTIQTLSYLPLKKLDFKILSGLEKTVKDASLVFRIKDRFSEKKISSTCKEYIKSNKGHGKCFINYQNELFKKSEFEETGLILIVAVGSAVIFKEKELIDKKLGKKKLATKFFAANNLIESNLKTMERVKYLIHQEEDRSRLNTIDLTRRVSYLKFFQKGYEKLGEIQNKQFVKYKSLDGKKTSNKVISEFKRSKKLRILFKDIFKDLSLKKINQELKTITNQLKEKEKTLSDESYFYYLATVINPEVGKRMIASLEEKKS